LKVTFTSLGRVTSLPLGSPVVGLSSFILWTGVFCNISSAMMEQLHRFDLVHSALLVRAGCDTGRWGWGL